MRILHIDSGREMRGGQFQVLALMRGLAARSHEQMLLARNDGPLYRAAEAEGLPVRQLSPYAIASWSRKMDLTHAHDAHAHTICVLLAHRPLVVARRVAFPIRSAALSRWKYRHVDCYIAISQCVKAELLKAGVPPERVDVVYDGTTLAECTSHGNRVVAPATEDPKKGSELLREAAKLAGVNVLFSTDLSKDLPDAGLFVYLTQSEGLGSAILFAMAHGVPVIASEVGGIPEIVQDGYTGLLTRNDARAVASAIRLLLADRPRAARMAQEARRRVIERFTLDRMVEDTLAVYERLENRE